MLFFSAQTFITVEYREISPNGKSADILSMIEAFVGLLSFILATCSLYRRFSKPSLKIAFSINLFITPYEKGHALMFKIVNWRNNVLLNSRITTLITIEKGTKNEEFNKDYFTLNLEIDTVKFFSLTWMLVHKIDESSTINGLSVTDLKQRNAEVIVMIETFDETFAQ